MGEIVPFPASPLRFWHVSPIGSADLWRADYFGPFDDFEGDAPEIPPNFRYWAIRNAREHPAHFGLPVIVQADDPRGRGRAA